MLEYTENGQYSVIPPSGYDGFSSVNVTVDVDCNECNLTTSTVTLTGDGEHTITPPEGYDGFSEVVVNVESDCEDAYEEGVADQKAKLASATFTENGSYNREDGWNTVTVNVDTVTPYNEGVEDGKDAQKALMTSLTAVSNGTYTREDGYNEVVVNVPSDVNNQNKQVTYTQNGTQTVIADNGYSGLGQVAVTVNVQPNLTSDTFTSNGTYAPVGYDGYSQVNVNVDTVTPYNNGKQDGIDEQKAKLISGTFTQNGTFNREDGYNQVIVNVPSDINNQNKTVNPSTSQQIITPSQGYSGLGQVTVNAVTAAIDPDIRPENIKKDVNVLGVVGTYDPQPDLEAKTATYTTNGTYSVVPSAGKDGLSGVEVTVNVDTQTPYDNGYADGEADQKAKLTTLTVTQNGTYTRADGYDEVVVNVQCGGGTDELLLSRETIEVVSDGDFPEGGIEYPIGVYSTDVWTITSKPNWVTTDPNSGNAGASLLTVTVNSIEDGRTGTITITNGTITKTITITQTDYSAKYLTLEVTSPGTLYWKQYGTYTRVLQHSGDGVNWTNCTSITTNNGCRVAYLSTGDKVMFRSSAPSFTPDSSNYHSLVFADGLKGNISGNINSFAKPYNLFKGCTGIQSAEHLVVPEGTSCSGTFSGCTGLTTAPKSLPRGYYRGMFYGCTRLVNAPELPSTTLDNECYLNMFYGCTSLEKAPVLPAITLATRCYQSMFQNCSSLNYIKAMFTTTPSSTYTSSWVSGVSATGTFVKNSAAT